MAFVFAGAALSFTAGTRAPVASMHHVRAPVAVMHHGEGEHDLMPRAGQISMSTQLQDDFLYGARGRSPASEGTPGFSGAKSTVVTDLVTTTTVGQKAPIESAFVYESRTPASQGVPGFSGPKSTVVTGLVTTTAPGPKAPIEGEFVYGARTPASKGLAGFSNPTCNIVV